MSDEKIDVDPELLEADATKKWQVWSGKLGTMKKAVPVSMTASDFSTIPGAPALYKKFTAAAVALEQYIGDGEEVFEGFARTLLKTAEVYMQAEHFSQQDISRVEQELQSL